MEKKLIQSARSAINSLETEVSDEEAFQLIEELVLGCEEAVLLDHRQKEALVRTVFHVTRRSLDILQPLAEDEAVNEIMVNGTDTVFIERDGRILRTDLRFDSREDLEEVIRRLAARVHREINDLNPIVDARLEDGSRLSAVYANVAVNGPILNIRRFPRTRINMEDLLEWETITPEAAAFLKMLVQARYNIFISGGTSSGKTTFLNVLSNYIPKEERLIVIEESAELQIASVENIVRLETRSGNAQGKGAVTLRQLIRASLRMRPDRIIVGEVRGAEVMDMVQAMSTGHDGSLSTGHGNSPEGMLSRLEAMYLTAADFPIEAVRGQIASAIDVIVHLGRLPDRSRKVLEIAEIQGLSEGKFLINTIFKYQQNNGLVFTGNELRNRDKLVMQGVDYDSKTCFCWG
ncbi:MAG: CpaF family protein [Clostridiales bacterium]|nr:CpaF family protein [Clostridiales bacterium]